MPNLIRLALLLAFAVLAGAAATLEGQSSRLILAQAEEAEEAVPAEGPETAPEDETAPAEAPGAAPDETGPAVDSEAVPDEETAPPEAETAPTDDAEAAPAEDTAPAEDAEAAREMDVQQVAPAEEGGVLRSESAMPAPVRETWSALIEAAKSGRIENLRPIIEDQPEPPMVSFGEVEDPIAHLRSLSGDAEGREILAILLEVLQAGFLHVDEGTPQEMYIWPYFARHPIEELTPAQMVELFTLLTAGDYQDMLSYGAYIFFRVGIAPDGRWLFFVAGD